ncbi:hypothetical protein J3E74DRAFT_51710 [Bipolaris maydis]|nr:hypothetical protein J3E74DRAFT_51710 [Bipolaris maydis]
MSYFSLLSLSSFLIFLDASLRYPRNLAMGEGWGSWVGSVRFFLVFSLASLMCVSRWDGDWKIEKRAWLADLIFSYYPGLGSCFSHGGQRGFLFC